jgi:hypothetical protein
VTAVLAQAQPLQAPSIHYLAISPMLVVFGAAIVGVLVEAFVPQRSRRVAGLAVALGGVLAALGLVVFLAQDLNSATDPMLGLVARTRSRSTGRRCSCRRRSWRLRRRRCCSSPSAHPRTASRPRSTATSPRRPRAVWRRCAPCRRSTPRSSR